MRSRCAGIGYRRLAVIVGFVVACGWAAPITWADSIVWDYGATGGTITTLSVNNTPTQNWAERVSFANDMTITGYTHYQRRATASDDNLVAPMYRFKLLANNGIVPGALLTTFELAPSSSSIITAQGKTLREIDFVFTTPLHLVGGTDYWIGTLGFGGIVNVGLQHLIQANGGDGRIAQFNGTTFIQRALIGDQMFRLIGHETATATVVPLPAAVWMGLLLLSAIAVNRLVRQRALPAA